jgi:hypothetical protein
MADTTIDTIDPSALYDADEARELGFSDDAFRLAARLELSSGRVARGTDLLGQAAMERENKAAAEREARAERPRRRCEFGMPSGRGRASD